MLNTKVCSIALGSFLAITFTLCVAGGVIAPGLPIQHAALQVVLPGFVWISGSAFLIGFVESFLYGAYAGAMFSALHNFFMRRWGRP